MPNLWLTIKKNHECVYFDLINFWWIVNIEMNMIMVTTFGINLNSSTIVVFLSIFKSVLLLHLCLKYVRICMRVSKQILRSVIVCDCLDRNISMSLKKQTILNCYNISRGKRIFKISMEIRNKFIIKQLLIHTFKYLHSDTKSKRENN